MNKFYVFYIQFALICGLVCFNQASLIGQSEDDCIDAYDITNLFDGMEEGDIVTSIQFDNTNATGGEETNPDYLICLFDKVIENSIWVTFIGDGNTYTIGTTECGTAASEYLNTAQALVYKGDCDNLEFISCNEFQQESDEENDFTFKAYLTTEVGVQYYMLLDGSNTTFDEDLNLVGKFCLEIERIGEVNCGDDDIVFTWKRGDGQDKYICFDEFHRLEVVEMVVPNGPTDPEKTTGYVMVISPDDLTGVDDPLNYPGAAVYCCSTEADRVYNYLHPGSGFFIGQHYVQWYYYYNASFVDEPGLELFPDLNTADCVVLSNQLEMFFYSEESDLAISSTNITNSSNAEGNGAISLTVTGGNGEYEFFWDNGASTSSIEGLAPGEYTVTISEISFCLPPLVQTFVIEGLTSSIDIVHNDLFSIFPNPSNGLFTLTSDAMVGETEIQVYSIDGKMVFNQIKDITPKSSYEIDLRSLNAGVYILKTFDGVKIGQQRLVISN